MNRIKALLIKAKIELASYHEILDTDKETQEEAYTLLKLIHNIEYELECQTPHPEQGE